MNDPCSTLPGRPRSFVAALPKAFVARPFWRELLRLFVALVISVGVVWIGVYLLLTEPADTTRELDDGLAGREPAMAAPAVELTERREPTPPRS